MLRSDARKRGNALPCDPSRRGYHAVYRRNETNHCPGCGRTHWYVGRVSAECGFCGTALPFQEVEYSWSGHGRRWRTAAARPRFT